LTPTPTIRHKKLCANVVVLAVVPFSGFPNSGINKKEFTEARLTMPNETGTKFPLPCDNNEPEWPAEQAGPKQAYLTLLADWLAC